MISTEEQEENSNKRTKTMEESLELNLERVYKEIECVNQKIELVENYLLSLAADDIKRDIYIDNLKRLHKDKDRLREERLILLRQSGNNIYSS